VSELADRIAAVEAEIARAARAAGRDPAEVGLVAVSKKHPVDRIRAALAAGARRFGENYAQELAAKASEITDPAVEWHFIGHLQRNKVKLVVGTAALIHAVDSDRLLRAIDRRAGEAGIVQPLLIEVNVAGEASKSGIAPDRAAPLVDLAGELAAVRLDGLMTMPPWADRPDDNRRHFAALRELAGRLATGAQPLQTLSMGTTSDYACAVEEGATLVRVGTAIFGPRPV
jgi:pyridoxal phosphate enzyme (YggS family)